MKKFEYSVVSWSKYHEITFQKWLNRYGQEGWQVVNIERALADGNGAEFFVVFQREIQ